MPITICSEEEQRDTLPNHARLEGFSLKQFPIVQRNFNSGWPLFQVSLFTPVVTAEGPIKYEPALGGGTCRFFYIGAFNFAGLLKNVSGNMEIMGNGSPKSKDDLSIDRVQKFLSSFSIFHKGVYLHITSSHLGMYGKSLTIEKSPFEDATDLTEALSEDIFEFALKPGQSVSEFADYDEKTTDFTGFTEREIEAAINEEVAVFYNGQIFVDMGAFFDKKVKNEEMRDYFSRIFQVEEFKRLKHDPAALQPAATQLNPVGARSSGPEATVVSTSISTASSVTVTGCHRLFPSERAIAGVREQPGADEQAIAAEASEGKCCSVM